MTGRLRPRTREVIGHEVEEVEVVLCFVEVDVLQGPLAGRESGGEDVTCVGKMETYCCEEREKVAPLFGVGRVFPVDLNSLSQQPFGKLVRWNTYYLSHQTRKPQQGL